MTARFFYRFHRWLALGAAFFLFCWVISGIVMAIPVQWAPGVLRVAQPMDPGPGRGESETRFEDVQITVPEAIEVARTQRPETEIQRISLSVVAESLVYVVDVREGDVCLVDAISGKPLVLDEKAAARIAQGEVSVDTKPVEVVRLEEKDSYFFGRLPACRFRYDDPAKTTVYVSLVDGQTRAWNRWTRLRRQITRWHEFEPLLSVVGPRRLRVAFVLAGAILAAAALASGLYLALPSSLRGSRR